MKIQINWLYPYQVSAGLQRDRMNLTVIDSSYFFSYKYLSEIPEGTNDTSRVPKMMPNTEFTKQFTQITE